MTFQEILDFTEWPERTARRYVGEAAILRPSMKEKGEAARRSNKPVDYDLEETCAILRAGGFGAGVILWLRKFVEEQQTKTLEINALKERLALAPPSLEELMTVREFMTANRIPIPAKGGPMYLQALANRCDTVAKEWKLMSFRDGANSLAEPDLNRYLPKVIAEAVRRLVPRFGPTGNPDFDPEEGDNDER